MTGVMVEMNLGRHSLQAFALDQSLANLSLQEGTAWGEQRIPIQSHASKYHPDLEDLDSKCEITRIDQVLKPCSNLMHCAPRARPVEAIILGRNK